ncbi:MAG: ATPase [Mesorhizobium sp.]|uniref:sugar ABC transporter permease n=1 Tax=unclassified Mesorhizobium TaxID=325217 RepID=UPI000FE5C447|nr:MULTISPECIES: ATPase [unclassified Mesorhizobium]RWE29747.1 MAG: ATPase [Mesorhizobium sp.]TGP88049.1 ATPase [Mesorhizobium sp. M8A.F.Ca.ET.218.01.1.1]TGT15630.1 ATPase [Mesorhizobium sp. M8A.F.Ca.ET.213.01.1.1]
MTYEASDPQALPAELKVERAETGRRRRLLHQARSAGGLLLAVGLVWLILFITTDGVFISDRNLINLMRQTSVTAMVALGMLVIIAQGEIDLSVGSFLSLCATVIALMESWAGLPAPVTILAALVLGAIVGLWNGLWVARLGVPAFVTTLGGMLAFRGISLAISGGNTISGIRGDIRFFGEAFITGPPLWLFLAGAMLVAMAPLRRVEARRRPKDLIKVAAGLLAVAALAWMTLSYRGLPMPVALTLVIGGALAYALKNLVWGRHAFAVGGNRTAAKIAGIAVGRQIVISYLLIGVLTAIAALMFVGRLGAAPPEAGYFLELNAISAVVIGGASLYGGTGTVTGVLLGALLMQSLSNGLSLMNVPSAYQNITSGLVLMFAVYLDAVAKRGGVPFLRQ